MKSQRADTMEQLTLSHTHTLCIHIYLSLAGPGLACGIQTLGCITWDLVPRPGVEPRPLRVESQPLDQRGGP